MAAPRARGSTVPRPPWVRAWVIRPGSPRCPGRRPGPGHLAASVFHTLAVILSTRFAPRVSGWLSFSGLIVGLSVDSVGDALP